MKIIAILAFAVSYPLMAAGACDDSALQACIAENSGMTNCAICAMDALPMDISADCDSFRTDICANFNSQCAPDCATGDECGQTFTEYYNCIVKESYMLMPGASASCDIKCGNFDDSAADQASTTESNGDEKAAADEDSASAPKNLAFFAYALVLIGWLAT